MPSPESPRRKKQQLHDYPMMDRGYQEGGKEDIARRQAEERLARFELREQRAAVETRKNMEGQIGSEESIAKGSIRDLINMDLLG